MSVTQHRSDVELAQYIETALWSSTDDDGSPLDDNYGPDDLAPEALESMRTDVVGFIESANPDALAFWEAELGAGQVGHDFWLTRNRRGAGFWDRFSRGIGAAYGDVLTHEAQVYGESYLYVGDDGKVYVS